MSDEIGFFDAAVEVLDPLFNASNLLNVIDRAERSAAEETANDPWWAAMTDGGRHLELGCGLAGRLLTLLQALPKLRAVGVELDPDLADEARRRAAELGVADRVEIITGDATTFTSDQQFDFGFWSQWFFPAAARPGALATLFACVRGGGAVRAPVFGFHDQIAQDPTGEQARSYAVDRVMLDAWGVPERTPEQLREEFEAAGFIDTTAVTREGGVTSVYARRP